MTVGAGSRLRFLLAAIVGVVLVLGAVAAIVVWDPVGDLVRAVDLPDVPRWLLWALGKVKFVVIAAFVLAVAVRELRRRRGA
jgi:hypothetical protein